MSVVIRSLNNDASYLLEFSHPTEPSTIRVVIDPWLSGPSINLLPCLGFSVIKDPSCYASLNDIPGGVDIVVISQAMPDHCHRETLRALDSRGPTTILAEAGAAKKIKGWKHFDDEKVIRLPVFNNKTDSLLVPVYRSDSDIVLATLIFTLMQPSLGDLAGVSKAVGITFTPQPPASSPTNARDVAGASTIASEKSSLDRPLSIIHCPHGIKPGVMDPYIKDFLLPRGGIPLTALLHPFDQVRNPWYLGGEVCKGAEKGAIHAVKLLPLAWIRTHDADKFLKGIGTMLLKFVKRDECEVAEMLSPLAQENPGVKYIHPVDLKAGEMMLLSQQHHVDRDLFASQEEGFTSEATTLHNDDEKSGLFGCFEGFFS